MYLPQQFAEPRLEELHRIVRDNPLGMLVTARADGGLEANHLPFLLATEADGSAVLHAHVARANPLWREVKPGAMTLVVFRGAHGYISPNWYPGKHETHRRVPTWNYEVVHAHGELKVRDDESFVRGVVARLTRQHEAAEPKPWKMTEAPPDYIAQALTQIVGIEIRIDRLEGKRKLNQHQSPADREGAIRALRERGRHGLADAMRDAVK